MNCKLWMLLIGVCFITPSFAQQDTYIRTSSINDQTFTGKIDNQHDITIHLEYQSGSSGHREIYSVKGWYRYDKYKEKIPVCGIFYNEGMMLYVFESKEKSDTLLNFLYDDYDKYRFWDMVEWYKNMNDYQEKFTLSYDNSSNISGLWQNQSRQLNVNLQQNNLAVRQQTDSLYIINNGLKNGYDLNDFGLKAEGNNLVAHKRVGEKMRVLISYSYPSRAYTLGMCGAGTEEGLLWLEFDLNGKISDSKKVLLGSCLDGTNAELISEDNDRNVYRILYSRANHSKELTIDYEDLSILIRKIQ